MKMAMGANRTRRHYRAEEGDLALHGVEHPLLAARRVVLVDLHGGDMDTDKGLLRQERRQAHVAN